MSDTTPIVTSFNTFDKGVVAFVGLFGLIGFLRGFTKEVLSIAAWIAAVLIAFYSFPFVEPLVREIIPYPIFSYILTSLVLFLMPLIAFSMIVQNIAHRASLSALGGLDRSLGLLFGIIKAGAILIFLFFLSALFWKTADKRPLFLQTSRSLPLIIEGVRLVSPFIPKAYLSPETIRNLTAKAEVNPRALMFDLARPLPKEINSGAEQASPYRDDQRRKMNELFQTYAE
jgi:membrane protein required for colicin V production